MAVPVQVPPGHVMQQIVDENGTLRHIILSPQPPHVAMPQPAPYVSVPPHPLSKGATGFSRLSLHAPWLGEVNQGS